MQFFKKYSFFIVPSVPVVLIFTADFFGSEITWGAEDYFVAWLLFLGAAGIYKQLAVSGSDLYHRLGVGLSAFTVLALVWVNLAVGMIGSEDDPANRLYYFLALGALFSIFAAGRRPAWLARVMFVAALCQLLVPWIAFLLWPAPAHQAVVRILLFNLLFAVSWLLAAFLFKRSV